MDEATDWMRSNSVAPPKDWTLTRLANRRRTSSRLPVTSACWAAGDSAWINVAASERNSLSRASIWSLTRKIRLSAHNSRTTIATGTRILRCRLMDFTLVPCRFGDGEGSR